MEKIERALLKNRGIVVFFMVIVAALGLFCYYIIPKQENPTTTIAAAVITTGYPGAGPEEVESFVTEKLEDKVKTLDRVKYYTSMSMDSASVITVMYDDDVYIDEVETKLRQAVADVQGELPSTCQERVVRTDLITNNAFIISLSSDVYSAAELESFAKTIQGGLEQVKGVSGVSIAGEKEKRVVVEADIRQMRLYGISIENILQLMQAQNLSIPAGSITYESGSINVASSGLFENLADIENTVVAGAEDSLSFVKLKDVAQVYIEDADESYYTQDGRDAVLLVGKLEKGENAVNIGKELRRTLDGIKAEMPEDLIFHEVMYAPQDIENNINSFILNLLESILLIVLVVMLGVRVRNALVISVALPMSILMTFIVMQLLSIEFQFISIAALIVSLGILVDNAVVISEAIQQNLNAGQERQEAILGAVRVTAVPVLTSTLTTVVTFSVIYFVPGVVGQVAGAIPTVVIAALGASYLVAMFLIPVLASFFFTPEPPGRAARSGVVRRFFERLLALGLNHPKLTLTAAFSTLGVAVLLALQLGIQFFPGSAKPVLYINVSGETMSLSETGRICEKVGALLDEDPLVEHYTSAVGSGLPSFFLTVPSMAPASNAAQFMLQLNEDEVKRYGGTDAAARHLQAGMDEAVAGAVVEVKCLEYSMPTDAKIVLTVSGEEQNSINAAAEQIAEALRALPGTDNVRTNAVVPQYQYKVSLDSERLSGYGLLKYDVIKQLNTSLMGAAASQYTVGGRDMEIVVRANVESLEDLQNLPIVGSVSGSKVLLGQVAGIGLEPSTPLIRHYNGQRYVDVLAGVLPGYSAAKLESRLQSEFLDGAELEGLTVTERGETSNMLDLVTSLGIAAVFAVLAIYIILLLQFRSFAKPLNVLTSIPLSLIGCCLGLWLFRMDIQVMALLGLVSLFGVVVNNGILLIEVIDAERRAGTPVREACRDAVRQRFRPIMLSSITTCIGLVPLVAAGDPMTAPMASVLLFGLLVSTVLTLVVVPTIYMLQAGHGGHGKSRN